jgi:regulator of replication initiation timing
LKNAQTQVELYKRELGQLQAKVDDLSGVDRLLQLENKLREGLAEKSELEKKVKELERQHKDQGKALEKMSNEEEFQAKMKILVDELRVWKEKVKKIETQ